jgi:hypothetical protein
VSLLTPKNGLPTLVASAFALLLAAPACGGRVAAPGDSPDAGGDVVTTSPDASSGSAPDAARIDAGCHADPAACPLGQVCAPAGDCEPGCIIDGTFYAPQETDSANSCLLCAPASSTTAWSDANGAACGIGGKCCTGTCMQTQTDVSNCGGCGQACTAGPGPSCSAGHCNYTLATVQWQGARVATDATNVYWTDSKAVMKAPMAGGAATTVAVASDQPLGIAIDATSVYWTDPFQVMKAPIAGGQPTTVAARTAGWQWPQPAIAVGGANVFWINIDPDSLSGAVMTAPATGGAQTILVNEGTDDPQQRHGWTVTADAASYYYWYDNAVMRAPALGGTPTQIASGQGLAVGMTVDATNVYWASSDGAVVKAPIAGGTAVTIAWSQGSAAGIAVDAKSVYWTGSQSGTVMKAPIAGGTAATLASGQGAVVSVAVGPTYVYWATGSAVLYAAK